MYDILGALAANFDEVHYMDFIGMFFLRVRLRSVVYLRTGNIMVSRLRLRKAASAQSV